MGHGDNGPGGFSDENLVPLLDLVLQMLMFFMATTNLAKENLNESVKLPLAQSAKPVEDMGADILYLNVDAKGNLLVAVDPTYPEGKIDGMENGQFNQNKRNNQIKVYLDRIFSDKKREAERRRDDPGLVRTLVILRAHQDANYKDVFNVLRLCRGSGFHKMQLRAVIDAR
jgi:biopolymer transport protein ExbD